MLWDMERQDLLDERDGEAARAAKAEQQLYMLEQQLADVRGELFRLRDVVLPEAEQRAVVAEEWRAYAERKQREAESFLLEAGEGKADATAEAEEVVEELFEQQEQRRRVERSLAAERSSRVAVEAQRDKAELREEALEEALDSMTKQLGAATAGWSSGMSVSADGLAWQVAMAGATVALAVALVGSVFGLWGCLLLLVFASWPLLLGKALAPEAFTQALATAATWAPGGSTAALGDTSILPGWAADTPAYSDGGAGVRVPWPSPRSQRRQSVASMSMSSPH